MLLLWAARVPQMCINLVALVLISAALKMLTTVCTSISWLEEVNI